MTREELQQRRQQVERATEIIRQVELLDAAKVSNDIDSYDRWPGIDWRNSQIAARAWRLGIDTLIAQLEQELADLDAKPKATALPDAVPSGHPGGIPAPWSLEQEAGKLDTTEPVLSYDGPPEHKVRKMVPEEVAIDDCPRLVAALQEATT